MTGHQLVRRPVSALGDLPIRNAAGVRPCVSIPTAPKRSTAGSRCSSRGGVSTHNTYGVTRRDSRDLLDEIWRRANRVPLQRKEGTKGRDDIVGGIGVEDHVA